MNMRFENKDCLEIALKKQREAEQKKFKTRYEVQK